MGKVADRYNLHVNPRYADKERKEAFEAEIDRELTQIVNTTTGLLLLTALSTMKHTVEIQPYLDLTAYGTDPCNGTEDPLRPTKPDSRVRVAPFAYAGPTCTKTLKDREGAAFTNSSTGYDGSRGYTSLSPFCERE